MLNLAWLMLVFPALGALIMALFGTRLGRRAISWLAPGMVLRSNIETKDGLLILCAGHHISEMTLEKIRNFESVYGIKEPLFVEAPESAAPPAD